MLASCEHCASNGAKLAKLRAENDELKAQLRELNKLCTLQAADLERVGISNRESSPKAT